MSEPEELVDHEQWFPRRRNGRPIRHAFKARHDSFDNDGFFDLLIANDIALVISDSGKYPKYSEQFSQLQNCGRDVYVYFINGAKVRAPAARMATIEQLGD